MRTVFSLAAIATSIGLLIYIISKVVGLTSLYICLMISAVIGAFLGGWALSNTPVTEWISSANSKMNEFIEKSKKEYEANLKAGRDSIKTDTSPA